MWISDTPRIMSHVFPETRLCLNMFMVQLKSMLNGHSAFSVATLRGNTRRGFCSLSVRCKTKFKWLKTNKPKHTKSGKSRKNKETALCKLARTGFLHGPEEVSKVSFQAGLCIASTCSMVGLPGSLRPLSRSHKALPNLPGAHSCPKVSGRSIFSFMYRVWEGRSLWKQNKKKI